MAKSDRGDDDRPDRKRPPAGRRREDEDDEPLARRRPPAGRPLDDEDEDRRIRKRPPAGRPLDDEDEDRPVRRRSRDEEDEDDRRARRLPPAGRPVDELDEVEDEDEEREEDDEVRKELKRRKRKRRAYLRASSKTRAGLGWAALGLGFHYFRLICQIIGMFLGLAVGFLVTIAQQGAFDDTYTVEMLGNFVQLGWFSLVALLGLLGSILCVLIPNESGARPIIILSLVLDFAAVPFMIALHVTAGDDEGAQRVHMQAAMGISFAIGLVVWALFMLYQWKVALYLEEKTLADEAMWLLLKGFGLMMLMALGFAFALGLSIKVPTVGGGLLIAVALGALVGWVNFLRNQLDLLGSLRQVLYRKS